MDKGSNPQITQSHQEGNKTQHEGRPERMMGCSDLQECCCHTFSSMLVTLIDLKKKNHPLKADQSVLNLETLAGRSALSLMFPADRSSACFNPVRGGLDHPSSPGLISLCC